MKEKLDAGIIEPVAKTITGEVVHHSPHQSVAKESSESTKLRIVYYCSARSNKNSPSLNDCLEIGPSLQPLLFDILLRNRMRSLCITGDIQKAFLQIRLREEDKDAQRLIWYDDIDERNVEEYCFSRVIFWSAPSPFILNTTFQKHVRLCQEEFPRTTRALLEGTYVDIQSGGEELANCKEDSIKIMEAGRFKLHKWHSNIPDLNATDAVTQDDVEQTYANQRTGRTHHETKILGVNWNKQADEINVDFKSCLNAAEYSTKRKLLAAIYGVYDIIELASSVVVIAKVISSDICLKKISWDETLSEDIL